MNDWTELEIETNYSKVNKDQLFSFIKILLDRIQYDEYFYTAKMYDFNPPEDPETDYRFKLILRIRNLKSKKPLENYLKKSKKTINSFEFKDKYEREHMVEIFKKTSEFCLSFDYLPQEDALVYAIHTICSSFLLSNFEEFEIYNHLMRMCMQKASFSV